MKCKISYCPTFYLDYISLNFYFCFLKNSLSAKLKNLNEKKNNFFIYAFINCYRKTKI